MEPEMLKVIAGLGVGAVFGLIVFWMYRIDRRNSEDRLTKLLEEDQKTRQENTKVLSELAILIGRLNGRKA